MNKCSHEGWIDDYLLGRLEDGRRKEFEEHYFNCRTCFEALVERDEIVSALKDAPDIFAPEARRKPSPAGRVFAWLSPRQWALAGAAALLLVAGLTVLPQLRGPAPRFVMTGEETVRGGALALVFPIADVGAAPAELRWKPLGGNVEYQVSLYEGDLIWKSAAKEPRIALPEDIRARMTAGRVFSWQVKAFSAEGTLVAVSGRARFAIAG
jgi:hypothetical protein